ncbi:MAG: hypothetical protein K2W97_06660 [Chthoniobacterales bacterium]|nr:hypothetical protein [Chthoniobacterales bacterium]
MKNKIIPLLLLFSLWGVLTRLQAMPPKVFRKEAIKKTTTIECNEEQERRATDSDDDGLSSTIGRGKIMATRGEEQNDDELSNTDSVDGSEEVVDNTSRQARQRPTAPFRAALEAHSEATQFILIKENGGFILKAVEDRKCNDVWENLRAINFLRMALRKEYGERARTIVCDVIGASNLISNNHLSAALLKEILMRADNNAAFFDSDIRYLEPILGTQLESLLDELACADLREDSLAKKSVRQKLRDWLRRGETLARRREENQEGAARCSQECDTIAHPARESDKKWRLLYNSRLESAISENAFVSSPQVGDEKRKFKRSYNRARRAMSDFSSEFASAIVDLNGGAESFHILNLKTIHELAESSWKTLDEHLEKISNAYVTLLSEISLKDNEVQHSIRNIATLWNEAATQTQLAEHLWNMGSKYATNIRLSEILKRAGKTRDARYHLGHVTSKEAEFLCESFVGPYSTRDLTDKDGTRLISEDKLKQSRCTEYKQPGEFTGWFGCRMANLQKKLDNGSWTNGHLIVSDIISLLPEGYSDDHYVLSSEDESELKTASNQAARGALSDGIAEGSTAADETQEGNAM